MMKTIRTLLLVLSVLLSLQLVRRMTANPRFAQRKSNLLPRDAAMRRKFSKRFQMSMLLALMTLTACGGCSGTMFGETGPSCGFAINETFEPVCSGETCKCRLSVNIFNGGHLTVSGMLHYDAFNAEGSKVAYADFQVTDLTVGSSRVLQNDLLDSQTNKPLEGCSNVSRVDETTVPTCP